jgi:hypothetical protein
VILRDRRGAVLDRLGKCAFSIAKPLQRLLFRTSTSYNDSEE